MEEKELDKQIEEIKLKKIIDWMVRVFCWKYDMQSGCKVYCLHQSSADIITGQCKVYRLNNPKEVYISGGVNNIRRVLEEGDRRMVRLITIKPPKTGDIITYYREG